MSRIIKSEIWTFIQDNTPVFNIVFQTLEVIYLVFLVIGVYRKDGRLTLPALVLYPIISIYLCFNSFNDISYILSKYDFGSFTINYIDCRPHSWTRHEGPYLDHSVSLQKATQGTKI